MNTPSFFRRTVQVFQGWRQAHPLFGEQLRGWGRLLFLFFSLLAFALIGIVIFERADPLVIAEQMQQNIPILRWLPTGLVMFLVPLTEWHFARFLLAPLGAFLLVLLAGALYVQDIYGLERFFPAFRHVVSSMFGLFYPSVEIDGGELKIPDGRINSLKEIGGPGFALIQPGNAVMFKHLRRPSRISLPQRYFMVPFETFGPIADLDDQHGYCKEAWAVTLDGIQLYLRDINFRYRLLPGTGNGASQARSVQDPYPFSQGAMQDMAYNRSAGDPWPTAVQRMIIGEITDFISSHAIDFLTAPRENDQDPRRDLRMQLFTDGISRRLRTIGTELLWIDVGHLDIMDISEVSQENVDSQRFAYWASRWIGIVNTTHAYGEASRMAYQERGRVEAQAELLKNITESLRGFELTGDPVENLRKMLLVRTAQILEGMGEVGRKPKEK